MVRVTYGRGLCGDPQTAQDVPLVADGPEGHLLMCALSATREDGDVTQGDGRDFQPGARGSQFTLPVGEQGWLSWVNRAGTV